MDDADDWMTAVAGVLPTAPPSSPGAADSTTIAPAAGAPRSRRSGARRRARLAAAARPPRPPRRVALAFPGATALPSAGCGTGASVYPLLRANPALFAYAFDVSAAAVAHLVGSPEYGARRVAAAVHDAAADPWPLPAGTADYVTLVWTLSALPPGRMRAAVAAAYGALRGGGRVLLRDYAGGDLAQVRLAAKCGVRGGGVAADGGAVGGAVGGRWGEGGVPGEGARNDATSAVPVEGAGACGGDELAALFTSVGFEVEELRTARVEHVNRKEGLTMRRCWVHAVFRKPGGGGNDVPAG
ncbi:hypothetical protein I4F81_011391 [Pyropia yezoensis]|uniref:Uncharacterized protein n=1 Tax=Pyropia yezoensis TaxID=2788 RepID=A0ACC3CF52_PYRYE|nr:hypothetical protein I4F81_011391 [Neopyropia yezoensis]